MKPWISILLIVLSLGGIVGNGAEAASPLASDLQAAIQRANSGVKHGKGTVLVVITAANAIPLANGKSHATGYFLRELTDPLKEVLLAGYDVEFATPGGKTPTVDMNSLKTAWYWFPRELEARAKLGKALAIRASVDVLSGKQAPKSLAEVAGHADDYVGMLVPGGHGPMVDLQHDRDLGELLRAFHAAGKPMAFICHGPVALMAAQEDGAAWPFAGYHISVVSTADEHLLESNRIGFLIGHIEGKMIEYPDQELQSAGAVLALSPPAGFGAPNFTRDREVISAQNPAAATPSGKILVKAIRERAGQQLADSAVEGISFLTFADLSKMNRMQLAAIYARGTATKIPVGDTVGMGLVFAGQSWLNYLSTFAWEGKTFSVAADGRVSLVNKVFGYTRFAGLTVDASVSLAPSIFDKQPSVRLDYSRSETLAARPVLDEIRKIGQDLYLGRVTYAGADLGFFTLYFVE